MTKKKKSQNEGERNDTLPISGRNNLNDNRFLIRNHRVQKKVTQYFSIDERELSAWSSTFSENNLLVCKIFSEEGKLREFVANRLTLKELLEKGEIKRERKL